MVFDYSGYQFTSLDLKVVNLFISEKKLGYVVPFIQGIQISLAY